MFLVTKPSKHLRSLCKGSGIPGAVCVGYAIGINLSIFDEEPEVKSTREVIFRARDLEAVKAHYSGTLRFPTVLDSPEIVGFDTGELNLYFEQGEPDVPVFEFTVDDVARAKAELIAAGCAVVEENPALPRLYLRDRFGVVFNLDEA
jgi:hypothetical protein